MTAELHRRELLAALALAAVGAASRHSSGAGRLADPPRGILLERLAWPEAEKLLTSDAVIVIALGAAAKEHGPHLPLNNDFVMAEYFKDRVLHAAPVVIAPTINYSYYPVFRNFPGSTGLSEHTAAAMITEIVFSLAHHGPNRFYILNTGVSTLRPLASAAGTLAEHGILLRYTDILKVTGDAVNKVRSEPRGTHAGEIETSKMLYMAPDIVDMSKAAREVTEFPETKEAGRGPFSRDPASPMYSRTGIWGDATLATREKGEILVEAAVIGLLRDIEECRTAALPDTKVPNRPGT